MKIKTPLSSLIKKYFGSRKNHYQPHAINPAREWLIGLLVAVIIFGVGASWSAFSYLKHRDKTVGSGESLLTTPVAYRQAAVDEALGKFRQRERAYKRLTANQYIVPEESEPEETLASTTEETSTANTATSSQSGGPESSTEEVVEENIEETPDASAESGSEVESAGDSEGLE